MRILLAIFVGYLIAMRYWCYTHHTIVPVRQGPKTYYVHLNEETRP